MQSVFTNAVYNIETWLLEIEAIKKLRNGKTMKRSSYMIFRDRRKELNKVEMIRRQNKLNNTIKETLSHFDERTDGSIKFDLNRIEEIPQGVCLKLIGYGDTYNSQYLAHHFQKLLDSCLIRVVLDMRRYSYISNEVGTIVWFLKELKNAGGNLTVFAMTKTVREVFDLLGVIGFLNEVENYKDGVDFFKREFN
jgi:anti-anti-sigma regulatory factor